MYALLGRALGAVASIINPAGFMRELGHRSNALLKNEVLGINEIIEAFKRGIVNEAELHQELFYHGINEHRGAILRLMSKTLLNPNENINLLYRGIFSSEEYSKRMGEIGYSKPDSILLAKGQEQKLDPQTVISAWRRQFFREGGAVNYFDDLKAQGLSDDRIDILKKVTQFFPNAQDLILWAVREVFSPEVVQQFEMDADFPEPFAIEAEKAGISREHAINFWRAHWDLPSISQGYEMLHRGIIKEDELDLLLRAKDVMPFWRDKLKKISFNPFTRVDVRRMHKMGVLSNEEVKQAYLDIGFNDERAEKMKEFTIEYNNNPSMTEKTEEELRKEELKGLSRSNIVGAFKDNIIKKEDAFTLLMDIGLDDEVALFHLNLAEFDIFEQERKYKIENIKDEYVAGSISEAKAIQQLSDLEITPDHQEKLLNDWSDIIDKRDKKPTKADLVSFLDNDIIDESVFKSEMSRIGYSDKVIKWFVELYNKSSKK